MRVTGLSVLFVFPLPCFVSVVAFTLPHAVRASRGISAIAAKLGDNRCALTVLFSFSGCVTLVAETWSTTVIRESFSCRDGYGSPSTGLPGDEDAFRQLDCHEHDYADRGEDDQAGIQHGCVQIPVGVQQHIADALIGSDEFADHGADDGQG